MSDSVLAVLLREDRYNDTIDAKDIIDALFSGAMPFSPLLWRLAMPSGPFRPFGH